MIFRDNLVISNSRVAIPKKISCKYERTMFWKISTLEFETIRLCRNVGHQLSVHIDVVPHPRKKETSNVDVAKAKKFV